MMKDEYKNFLKKYAANSERLRTVGITSWGYDPGHLCRIEGTIFDSVEIPQPLVDIICDLIKRVYPHTKNDNAMIKAYRKRTENK